MTGAPPSPCPSAPSARCWHLVVPIKDAALGKTRLAPPHPLARPALARAVALDTLDEVCRALPPAQVTVVTSDTGALELAHDLGARTVDDPGLGLNPAIEAGLRAGVAAGARGADEDAAAGPRGWAVLLGDLPSLRSSDLLLALGRCAAHPDAVVPDAQGTGTVLLTSTRAVPVPRFGPGSAARHAQHATLLELDLPRLRQDVDTAADLQVALALGVGPRTAAALSGTSPG